MQHAILFLHTQNARMYIHVLHAKSVECPISKIIKLLNSSCYCYTELLSNDRGFENGKLKII